MTSAPSTNQASQLIDRSWFVAVFVPNCLPVLVIFILLGTILGFQTLIHLVASASEDLQIALAVFVGGIVLIGIVSTDNARKVIITAPGGLFFKRIAGRFTALTKLFEHFENYPGRRYGMDSAILWPRLWLVLPNDVRQVITDLQASYLLSITYYLLLRRWFSLTSCVINGMLVYLASSNIGHYWWCLVLALILCVCYLRIHYFQPGGFVSKQAKFSSISVGFGRLLIEPISWLFYLLGVLIAFCFIALCLNYVNNSLFSLLVSEWELSPTRVVLVTLEALLLFVLTNSTYSRMTFSAISFMQSLQSAFDVYRLRFAEALDKKDLSAGEDSEKIYWRSKSSFLINGSALLLPERLYRDDSYYNPPGPSKKRLKALYRLLKFDKIRIQRNPYEKFMLRLKLLAHTGAYFAELRALWWRSSVMFIKKEPEHWN